MLTLSHWTSPTHYQTKPFNMVSLSTLKAHLWSTTSSCMILSTTGASLNHRPSSISRTLRWHSQFRRLRWTDRQRSTNRFSPQSRRIPGIVKNMTILWWLPWCETKFLSFVKTTMWPSFSSKLCGSQSELNHLFVALLPETNIFYLISRLSLFFKLRTQVLLKVSELGNKLS